MIRRVIYEILYLLPKDIAVKIRYKISTGKNLNLKNPITFDEKIQYLSVYKYGKKESDLSDKLKVRDYITKIGLSDILTKIYGVYDKFDEINFESLPDEYVLKTNHGCACTIIKQRKVNLDKKGLRKKITKSLQTNYAKSALEYHYASIKPKIICEQYLKEDDHINPADYKFFCFDGFVDCCLACFNREKNIKKIYYNCNWEKINYVKKEYITNDDFPMPKNYDKMIEIASKISKGFPFVRVDLYNINGKIYFGEMTFTPKGGINSTYTDNVQKYLGSLIDLK